MGIQEANEIGNHIRLVESYAEPNRGNMEKTSKEEKLT